MQVLRQRKRDMRASRSTKGAEFGMKRINLRFEMAEELEDIEVLIRASERDSEVLSLIERIAGKPPDAFTASAEDGTQRKINFDSIVSVSVTGKQVRIVTDDGESCTLRQPLQSIENALDGVKFVRISRYEIVNLDKIQKCDFTLNGTLRLELTGGIETWVSRRSIPSIRRRLSGRE